MDIVRRRRPARLQPGASSGVGTNLRQLERHRRLPHRPGEDTIATVNGDAITRERFHDNAQTRFPNSARADAAGRSRRRAAAAKQCRLRPAHRCEAATPAGKKNNVTVTDDEIAKKACPDRGSSGLRQSLGLPATASLADIDAALTKAQSQTVEERLPDDTLRQFILIGDPQSRLSPASCSPADHRLGRV